MGANSFLSADPVGPLNGGSTFGNRYSYVGYDPVNHTDPTGTQTQTGGLCFGAMVTPHDPVDAPYAVLPCPPPGPPPEPAPYEPPPDQGIGGEDPSHQDPVIGHLGGGGSSGGSSSPPRVSVGGIEHDGSGQMFGPTGTVGEAFPTGSPGSPRTATTGALATSEVYAMEHALRSGDVDLRKRLLTNQSDAHYLILESLLGQRIGGMLTRWLFARTVRSLIAASETVGGHLIARHVGKSAAQLAARLASTNLPAASTFRTLAEARAGVAAALEAGAPRIAQWAAAGAKNRLKLEAKFQGGKVLLRGATQPETGTGVRVILEGDGAGGWYILTGFPTP